MTPEQAKEEVSQRFPLVDVGTVWELNPGNTDRHLAAQRRDTLRRVCAYIMERSILSSPTQYRQDMKTLATLLLEGLGLTAEDLEVAP